MPIFFIMVGVEFDLAALLARPEAVVLALAVLVAAYVVKVSPAAIFGRRYGLKESLAIGILITPGLSLAVVATEMGFRLQPSTRLIYSSAMILLSILTAAISPVVFERMVPHAPGDERERVVIVGANERGILLATRLNDLAGQLLLVDKEPGKVQAAQARGFDAVLADVADPAAWEAINPNGSTIVVITTQDDDINLGVVEILKENYEVDSVVADAVDPEIAEQMEHLGGVGGDPGAIHALRHGEPGAVPRPLRPPQPRGRGSRHSQSDRPQPGSPWRCVEICPCLKER